MKGMIVHMSLYTIKDIVAVIPEKDRFAVPAFNVHNMEYTKAIIKAAELENSPVILMLGEPMLEFAGLDMLATIAMFAAKNTGIPVAVALDHGKKIANIDRSIELGLSVMVDGSHLLYEENIAFTKRAVELAHSKGLSVEGELGSLSGSEDGEKEAIEKMTDPSLASDYVKKTGIDILAVSIGNCHGLYKGIPRIDINRLKEIRQVVSIPIVMHGGSDLPDEISSSLIDNGIAKFNIGTDIKISFSEALKEVLNRNPLPFQPFDSLQYAMDAACKTARTKIRLMRASGKADIYR
ncbi:MAG: class II fructose-bisphosphate aldolase [Clostridia bacterium]